MEEDLWWLILLSVFEVSRKRNSPLGWVATIAEVVIVFGLLTGWQLQRFAQASGILLFIFAITMMLAHGIKAPLDYSVLTASAASLYLAAGKDKEG